MILLAPIQAFDQLLTGLLTVFASPRSIFFRKYILAPALRLLVVVVLILAGSGVWFLAVGYVAAGAVGIGALRRDPVAGPRAARDARPSCARRG